MKKGLASFIIVIALIGLAFYGQANFRFFNKPCVQPISYSLGNFDSQFGISQTEFLADLEKAAQIWELPTNKDLFKYDPNSTFLINLKYDYRQEATDRLKSLGYSIDNTQASYDQLKIRYNQMVSDYNRLKQSLETAVADYNKQKAAYEAEVKKWNDQGGASKNVVSRLNTERDQLNSLAEQITKDQQTLNSLADDINTMVDILNRMASVLKLNVQNYNNIGGRRGDEFEEGAYIESGRSKQIDIYEFDSEERLVRVLAHEFGHALGLQHIESDPQAIMYRLNQGENEKATPADIAAVSTLCGLVN
jgi:hypothetical protein